jgi:hypothetical protein
MVNLDEPGLDQTCWFTKQGISARHVYISYEGSKAALYHYLHSDMLPVF